MNRERCGILNLTLLIVLTTYVLVVVVSEKSGERSGSGYVYNDAKPSAIHGPPEWDPNGYVFFCLCMGWYIG